MGCGQGNFKTKSKRKGLLSLYAAIVMLPVIEPTGLIYKSDIKCIPCTHRAERYVKFALGLKLHRH